MTEHPWRTALVTGASSGIGESMTRQLASAGVQVLAVARREERLHALADELPRGSVLVLAADLTKKKSVAAVADAAREVDLLVNNAGFGTSGRFVDADPKRMQREIKLNVLAVTLLTRSAVEGMTARGRGWICNVSSIAGFQPAPNLAVYAATKAFVTTFTEGLHEELRGTGVSATALCPGLTRTEFQSVSNTTGQSRDIPDFAWMTADEVAAVGLADTAAGVAVSVPGLANKAFVVTTGVLPRSLVRRMAGLVQSQR
ncbi:MAG TPA: SDR family oxidoreductase [Acidimicrobiales bacterium]|nr:SDR family oxidoreductase [Acidimicrobiales bacterium]